MTGPGTYLLPRLLDLGKDIVVGDRAFHDNLLLLQADVVRGDT